MSDPLPRILIVFNPKSGRGLAPRALHGIERSLVLAGLEPIQLHLDQGIPTSAQLSACAAVVVVGGDGTVNAVATAAAASNTPIYHFPMGNENLFAREFGMKPDPDLAAQWILSGKRRTLDLARVTEGERQLTPFVIMLSVGPDAGVIRRLSATRRGAINHLSYLAPIAQELFTPTLPRISIEVDGRSICDARRGMVVVANSRQYGARFDPAKNAKMDDGLLDVTFFPAENGAAWAWWMLMSLARVAGDLPGHVHAQGRQVRLVLPEGGSAQADGEHTWSGDGPIELSMAVEPGVLSVCAPTAS